jgi:hypothetical protein
MPAVDPAESGHGFYTKLRLSRHTVPMVAQRDNRRKKAFLRLEPFPMLVVVHKTLQPGLPSGSSRA